MSRGLIVRVEARHYGASGVEVFPLALGAGGIGDARVSEREAEALLAAAVDCGVTLVDTARSYGASEERIGRFLAEHPRAFAVSTKGGYGVDGVPDWTAAAIARGIDDALRRLGVDRIDVFHLHSCPLDTLRDDALLAELDRARELGKIRVAAYSGDNDALAWAVESGRFGGVECSINAFDQASVREIVPKAIAKRMGVLAKRPLANAPWRFAGTPRGDYCETYWHRMRVMGFDPSPLTWSAVALRFAAFAPGVTAVLVGTTRIEHLRENARILSDGPLAPDVVAALQASFATHGASWRGEV